jgi:hypothetical protein
MMKRFRAALMIVALSSGALFADLPRAAAGPAVLGPGDYAIIRFIGDHSTRIAFADGHIEYAETLLAGQDPPQFVDKHMYQTILLINLLAKRGYEYAGKFKPDQGPNIDQILMKKVR